MCTPISRRATLAVLLLALPGVAQARARAYTLVTERSRIVFIFTTGGTQHSGTVPVRTADITVDIGNLARSKADVTADIRRVSTGLIFFTQAIKSRDLLDADTHPIVRFRSRRVQLGARGRISEGAEIAGDLTLRGVTRPIVLSAKLSRPAGTPTDDLTVLYIQLNGQLNRRDFGADGYSGLAEDFVALDIRAEIRALD